MAENDPQILAAELVDGEREFLAWITASVVRDEMQGVVRSPRTELPQHIGDPAHGDVIGKKNSGKRTRIAKTAVWEVEPPDDAVPDRPDGYYSSR